MSGKVLKFAPEYTVTRSGRVFKNGEPIAINKTQFWGQKCEINGNTYLVHRLVAYAYLGLDLSNDKAFIEHKDDNQQNNNTSNLRIGDNTSNTQDRTDKGRSFQPKGEKNPQSKISASDVSSIKSASKSGVSGAKLAKRFILSEAQISRIINGKRW